MIYAGPANTPIDMQYMYQNTACQGYIGGSTFDRIPAERAIYNTTKAFKSYGRFWHENNPMTPFARWRLECQNDGTEFVQKYVEEHYMDEVKLSRSGAGRARVPLRILVPVLKKKLGIAFTEYLIRYRVNKAKKSVKSRNRTAAGKWQKMSDIRITHSFQRYLRNMWGYPRKSIKEWL